MGPDSQFKKVLMVALEFPPCHSAGVKRTLTFYRNLESFGWKPIVLTARASIYDRTDPNSTESTFAEDSVYRAFGLNAYRHLSFRGKHWGRLSAPDRFASWFWHAVLLGRRLIKQHQPDAIWSTFPCSSAHKVAHQLSQEFRLPWIADFRDPYHADTEPAGVPAAKAKRIDRDTARYARKLIFTTQQARDLYLQRYTFLAGDKTVVIPNGFSEQEFARAEHALQKPGSAEPDGFTVLHSGSLYGGARDPARLLEALADIKQRGTLPANFQLIFRGVDNDPRLQSQIDELQLQKTVVLKAPVSFERSVVEILQADALLLIQAPEHKTQIPGKVYEYLRAKKPIIALGTKGSAVSTLLSDIPHAYVADLQDKQALASGLSHLSSFSVASDFDPSTYDRMRGVESLAEVFEESSIRTSSALNKPTEFPQDTANPGTDPLRECVAAPPFRPALRVGLVENTGTRPAWIAEVINVLQDSTHTDLVLIARQQQSEANTPPLPKKLLLRLPALLLTATERALRFCEICLLERRLYVRDALKAAQPEGNSAGLQLVNLTEPASDLEPSALPEIELIKKSSLDAILDCSDSDRLDSIAACATAGLWKVRTSDAWTDTGEQSKSVWPTSDVNSVTLVTLEMMPPDLDGIRIIGRSTTSNNLMSDRDHASTIRWKGVSLMLQELTRLHEMGVERFLATRSAKQAATQKMPILPAGWKDLLRRGGRLIKFAARKTSHTIDSLLHVYQWEIIFKLDSGFSTDFSSFKRIVPPRNRSWADPHILYKDGRYHIFIEEREPDGKGHISTFAIDQNGEATHPEMILERPYHLSYPYVFEYQNEIFMIPETSANRTVELYRAIQFPYKWEHTKNLMENVFAVDTTLSFEPGRIWLFANIKTIDGNPIGEDLSVFWSDDLLNGEWQPHPENPVVSDCRGSRSAGNIFVSEGKNYRPAQIGAPRYGYGIAIHAIETLDQANYSEKAASLHTPNWDKAVVGLHTVNSDTNLCVADVLRRRNRFSLMR